MIDEQTSAHLNFMLGGGRGDGHGGLAAGSGLMAVYGDRACRSSQGASFVFAIQLGVRVVGGMTEPFCVD